MKYRNMAVAVCTLGMGLLQLQNAVAEKGLFDGGGLFDEIGKSLDDAGKELDKAKPLIDQQGKDLQETIDKSVKDGFLNLQSITDEVDSAVKDLKGELDGILSDENIKNLESFLDGLDDQALESIKEGILEELEKKLDLAKNQVDEVIPILKNEIDKRGKMLEEALSDGQANFKDFKKESKTLLQETLKSLDDVLTPEQLQKFENFSSDSLKRIGKLFKELKIGA